MLRPAGEVAMFAKGTVPYRVMAAGGQTLIGGFERLIARARGDRTFYDVAEFPWVVGVEKDWPVMQEELIRLLSLEGAIPEFKEISEEQARITRGVWRTQVFYVYGRRVAANCDVCPETARALRRIPGMTSGLFSILTPGAHLTPHRGPYRGVLRYHLGLVVPPDALSCGIRVGDDVRHWREGESMIFDDTHEHEAWNRSDRLRAVLFVDFVRDLPFPLSVLNRAMIALIAASPFVQNMIFKLNQLTNRVSDIPTGS